MEDSPKLNTIIAAAKEEHPGKAVISIEFFPPKTEAGIANLYKIAETLKFYKPIFADVTWGAGGSTSDLTMELCVNLKNQTGLVPNMHLTCTNMEKQKVIDALDGSKKAGITNILALRGDPPAGQEKWEAVEGGFNCALDLVKFIRAQHGDYFHLTVAGYPEGHPSCMKVVKDMSELTESEKKRCAKLTNAEGVEEITVCKDADFETEIDYLKQKVDAGADCIITQLFFDVDVFVTFVNVCRERGITVPIIPGIMCVAAVGGFKRMVGFCKTRVPDALMEQVNACENDTEMKALGISYGTAMCRELMQHGFNFLHIYTLNASYVTQGILNNLADTMSLAGVPAAATAAAAAAAAAGSTVFDATVNKNSLATA